LSDNRKPSFWTTATGVITAVAGLLSSVGALLGTLYALGYLDGGGSDQKPVTNAATAQGSEQQDTDGDGEPDARDPFAFDSDNGRKQPPDVVVEFTEVDPETRVPVGFTGIMIDGETSPERLFDPGKIRVANRVLTVENVDEGDPSGRANNQRNAFQLGVDPRGRMTIYVHTGVQAPIGGKGLRGYQQMGLFIGTGDQDNYVKLVWEGRQIVAVAEVDTQKTASRSDPLTEPPPDRIDLYLTVDTRTGTVEPSYRVERDGVRGEPVKLEPVQVKTSWWGETQGLAVGVISSSRGPAPEFTAAWDVFQVKPGRAPS
jgi:hypothetical protein